MSTACSYPLAVETFETIKMFLPFAGVMNLKEIIKGNEAENYHYFLNLENLVYKHTMT